MGGDGAWDNRMSDMLKNFDLNSTEVKQQFGMVLGQNIHSVLYSVVI
jgi:tetrahydromethanopterin S-methyltransferase subunit G